MNKQIWLDWRLNKPCPTCKHGYLIPTDKGLMESESRVSKRNEKDYPGCPVSDYVFSQHFECDQCGEAAAAVGFVSRNNYSETEEDVRYAKYSAFIPAPPIISIPGSCDSTVKHLIIQSFGLFWMDESACANKIRIAIEVLMDSLRIKKTHIVKKKREKLSLHNRILEYKKQNAEVANHLLAIKWIGNAGSHLNTLSEEQILDAFSLLEYALELIFNDRKRQFDKMSNQINKKKKLI